MEKVKNLHINYSFMNNSLVNNSQVNSAQVNSARVNNSRVNNKLTSKFTSLALAASIIFGTVAIPTETKCDYSFSDIACKTTKALGCLLITKLGVKIVASSFFIAQNIAQFYKDKNNSKTGLLKHLPFYLGNTGLLFQNLINYKKPAANLYSAWLSVKIILGKKRAGKVLPWIGNCITKDDIYKMALMIDAIKNKLENARNCDFNSQNYIDQMNSSAEIIPKLCNLLKNPTSVLADNIKNYINIKTQEFDVIEKTIEQINSKQNSNNLNIQEINKEKNKPLSDQIGILNEIKEILIDTKIAIILEKIIYQHCSIPEEGQETEFNINSKESIATIIRKTADRIVQFLMQANSDSDKDISLENTQKKFIYILQNSKTLSEGVINKIIEYLNNLKTEKIYSKKIEILENINKEITKTISKFHKKTLTQELLNHTKSDLHKFFAKQYGVKLVAQSLLIAANGCSFYNQENCVTTGVKKALPFYISNSGSLLDCLAGKDPIESAKSLAKIIIGENRTNLITKYLRKTIPEFLKPILGMFCRMQFLMKENKPDKEIGHEKAGIKIKI